MTDSLDKEFEDAAAAAGHVLERDEDGAVNWFAMEAGFCNGPRCARCGEMWCHHCTRPEKIGPCLSDAELEEREKAAAHKKELRARAAEKLTEEEREACGL